MSSSSLGTWIGQTFFFSDILESDTRTPVLQFTIPDIILQIFLMSKNNNDDDDVQYKFGILIPYVEFWIALAVTLLMGAIFSSCISVIMYYFIILPQKQSKKNNNDSMTHFLVGFGIVMPICVVSPYLGLRYFGIKNKVMKFLTGVVSCLYRIVMTAVCMYLYFIYLSQ